MKKTFVIAVLLAIVGTCTAQIILPNKSGNNSNQGMNNGGANRSFVKNMFDTESEAEIAWQNRNYAYYIPSYLDGYSKNATDGISKVKIPLEADAIVKMLTVKGIKYVILPQGTDLRYYKNNLGVATVPYAHEMCGNPIYGIKYPYQKQVSNLDNQQGYQNNQNFDYNNRRLNSSETYEFQGTLNVRRSGNMYADGDNVSGLRINNYSERTMADVNSNNCTKAGVNYQYADPNSYSYTQPYSGRQRRGNGESFFNVKNLIIGVAVSAVIITGVSAIKEKKKDSSTSNGTGQNVVTLPATTAKTNIKFEQQKFLDQNLVGFSVGINF